MGVPKFYRWLSERYPCINENINQYNVPEFDYFYLDMNGIFHNCSHPSDDVHFRISESKIFENIGTYIEHLFNLIQPKKVFFLSVDGVAPRSKMNQQRTRRFRSAKEKITKEIEAKQKGEVLPNDPSFDSNCITPGTEFMEKLHQFLIDFLGDKIQNNLSWKFVEVIYSGHDVPGEGEHKIMDYIRYCKTKNTFAADAKHCLYGLDADLINLGLCSHEPYFSLLREEVIFTKHKQRDCDPFKINFQLLHLSLLRDYLYNEFVELKEKISFPFNLERIIDDWILINFVIGNDFLPHIPRLTIEKGGIPILYDAYKQVLPQLDGYLNCSGNLNVERFQIFIKQIAKQEALFFNENNQFFTNDLSYINEDNFLNSDVIDEESEDFEEDEFELNRINYYTSKLNFTNLDVDVSKMAYEYLKGIQWVVSYYFNGCTSWNWYYPYYYGPYLSDLAKIETTVDFYFEPSKPFPPLLQQLAVLPQASKSIMPKSFQKLTCSSDSPLIEYFPNDFKVDLNEKMYDYESILLIPFMDEKILMDTYIKHENEFSPEENNRNKKGFHYDLTFSETSITNPEELLRPNKFFNVKVKKIKDDFFILPPEIIYKDIGKHVDTNAIIGFPTLKGVEYDIKIEMAKIKVFTFPSKYLNMLLIIRPKEYSNQQLMEIAKNHLGKLVYADWPFLSEAKLVELINDEHKIFLSGNEVSSEKLSNQEVINVQTLSRSYCNLIKNQKGIIIDKVNVVAKVLTLKSQRYIINDAKIVLHKEWAEMPTYLPLDLVILNVYTNHRFPMYRSLSNLFSKGESFYLIDQPFYGYKAEVIEYNRNKNLVKVNVFVSSEPDFSHIIDNSDFIINENYIPDYKFVTLAKNTLNIKDKSFKRLFGSVLIEFSNKKGYMKKINIGLKLKSRSYNDDTMYCIPGYSKIDGNLIMINMKVMNVLKIYYEKFPFIFEMIMNINKTIFTIDDAFPNSDLEEKEKIAKINELKDWIDSLELTKIGLLKSDATYLDNSIVKAIEETIESHTVLMCEENSFDCIYKPSGFFIPEFNIKGNTLPDPQSDFCLYDRVVNVKNCIPVRFGVKGTIIGIYSQSDALPKFKESESKSDAKNEDIMNLVIEVLFDESFDAGLQTRSTKKNVFKMQPSWLINISYGLNNSKMTSKSMFKNNYQSLQNSFKGQNKFMNYASTSFNSDSLTRKLNTSNQFESAKNEKKNSFNHSENSRFKILKKPMNKNDTNDKNNVPDNIAELSSQKTEKLNQNNTINESVLQLFNSFKNIQINNGNNPNINVQISKPPESWLMKINSEKSKKLSESSNFETNNIVEPTASNIINNCVKNEKLDPNFSKNSTKNDSDKIHYRNKIINNSNYKQKFNPNSTNSNTMFVPLQVTKKTSGQRKKNHLSES